MQEEKLLLNEKLANFQTQNSDVSNAYDKYDNNDEPTLSITTINNNNSKIIENIKEEYESQLRNMKNHYEAQLLEANKKIKEMFEDRQAKINSLNLKMKELQGHLESYSKDLVEHSSNFGSDDFSIDFQEFHYD